MSDTLILHNPLSRRGRHVASRVRDLLGRGPGEDLEWRELGDLAGATVPVRRLVVIGGDGTINAAASWLEERRANCPLGIVPAGTGNNLARGFGLPLATEAALRLALEGGETAPLDAIVYTATGVEASRLIIQSAALGFPSEIAARYDRWRRHRLFRWCAAPAGPLVYRLLAFAGLGAQKRSDARGRPLLSVECRLGDEVIDENVLAVFIGNEKSLGGNFFPCPRASVDDGKLDLCIVRGGTGESYLRLFRKLARGEHLDLGETVIYRQTEGPLEISLSAPSSLLADGDLWVRSAAYRLELLPGRFEVVVGRQAGGGTGGGETV